MWSDKREPWIVLIVYQQGANVGGSAYAFFGTQQEAIDDGRQMARENGVYNAYIEAVPITKEFIRRSAQAYNII